jgi:hypothetical protein
VVLVVKISVENRRCLNRLIKQRVVKDALALPVVGRVAKAAPAVYPFTQAAEASCCDLPLPNSGRSAPDQEPSSLQHSVT